MKTKDQQRIIALQRQIKIARAALMRMAEYDSAASNVLDEINQLEWNSKPSPLQGIAGHDRIRP